MTASEAYVMANWGCELCCAAVPRLDTIPSFWCRVFATERAGATVEAGNKDNCLAAS